MRAKIKAWLARNPRSPLIFVLIIFPLDNYLNQAFPNCKLLGRTSVFLNTLRYKFYFFKGNLQKAYRYRFMNIEILSRQRRESEGLAEYMEIVYVDEIKESFIFKGKGNFVIQSGSANPPTSEGVVERKKYNGGNIILIGPAADLDAININDFDTVVFTKPIFDVSKRPKNTVLILNNIWTIKKAESVKSFASKYAPDIIFSPQRIEGVDTIWPHDLFASLPFGSSLMGLQRALAIVNHYFDVSQLTVEGFDFSTSWKPYKKWYPTLMASDSSLIHEEILASNCKHDFLLNVLFCRRFVRHVEYPVSGKAFDLANACCWTTAERFFEVNLSRDVDQQNA